MAFTLRLSDEVDARLREQAERERRPLAAVVEDAVAEYVERRSLHQRVDEALDVLIPQYTGLLKRLGE
ncbi:MAG: ribbon-helix-helix protein, CopG family [Actinomycetota bacterium]|nr:ribbon-helix-helix protein, CopG family [Actinomycetota bacterium]